MGCGRFGPHSSGPESEQSSNACNILQAKSPLIMKKGRKFQTYLSSRFLLIWAISKAKGFKINQNVQKGEIKFFDSRTGNNFLFWNIDIDVPFETKLQFRAIMDDEKNSLRGIVAIGTYGEIEFQGFGEWNVAW